MYLGVESITEELVVRVCLSLELLSQFTLVLPVDAICLHVYTQAKSYSKVTDSTAPFSLTR